MRQANLYLHCGANAVSREHVSAVLTPTRTETWVPIAHDRLLMGVQHSLERSGLHVVTESHGLIHDGSRYFGLLQVANGSNPDDFGLIVGLRNTQERRFATYQGHELSEGQAHDLVIQALDARVVPVTKIPDVLTEWREPRHPEFREGRTAWRLFNAFTEILKGNLGELLRRTQGLHGLMDAACGLVHAGAAYRTEDAEIQVTAAV